MQEKSQEKEVKAKEDISLEEENEKETRDDKIKRLKNQIAKGSYTPDMSKLVENIYEKESTGKGV